jgi:hypothetical protein
MTGKYWTSKENRRKFFDSYAANRSFSPLIPDNWYSIDTNVIKKEKVPSPLPLSLPPNAN